MFKDTTNSTKPQIGSEAIGRELDKEANKDRFPVETLPEPCKKLVEEAEQTLNHDPAFTSTAVLTVLSTAIGNSRELYLKEKRTYPATLFTAMVGKPGSGKTPAAELIFQPLKDHDGRTFKEFNDKLAARKEWELTPKEEREPEPPEKPIWKRKLLNDHTPEALADVLSENPKGVCLFTDELATWFQSFQRYNPGPDLERWLSIWSRSQITIDRKSQTPVQIRKPFCSVFGGIQPAVLPRLFQGENGSNGFTDRILFAVETPNRPTDQWNKKEMGSDTHESYERLVSQLNELEPGEFEDGNLKPGNIYLNEKAKEKWAEYYNNLQERMKNAEDSEASILSKLEQYVPRITLILALGNNPQTNEATENDLQNAITLADYFEMTAKRVREMAGTGSNIPDKKTIIKHCVNELEAKQIDVANALKVSKEYVSMVIAGKK